MQLKIPGLQREHSRRCVDCGAAAELFCAGCRITPYCGERCQRRDWDARHRSVCHNLARSAAAAEVPVTNGMNHESDNPTSALRRPRSPAKSSPRNDPSDKGKAKYIPPAEKNNVHQKAPQRMGNQYVQNGNQAVEETSRNSAGATKPRVNQTGSPRGNIKESQGDAVDGELDKGQMANTRRFTPSDAVNGELDKGQVVNTRRFTPNIRPPLRQPAKVSTETAKPALVDPPVETKVEKPKPDAVPSTQRNVTPRDVTPRKPLVPTSYVLEKLPVGASFMALVVERATEGASKQPGFVCLTLHDNYAEDYNRLCEEFSVPCQKDTVEYTPRIGETFAYFCAEDEGWYRARCLARSRGALLDSGRVVSLTPAVCRRLPAGYANIPEFVAVLNTQELQVGAQLTCIIVSSSTGGIKVTVAEQSDSSIRDVEVSRWIPEVEYPTERQESIPPETKTPKPVQETLSKQDTKSTVEATQARPLVVKEPLVPSSYVVGMLATGITFMAEAIALAADCESAQAGYICLTLQEGYANAYSDICDEFSKACETESRDYIPRIGETFAYFCAEDEGWYRARCLARSRGALLDSGRVVSLTPAVCRRLPAAYANVPEFVAVFKSKDLQIGGNLMCTVVGSSSSGIKVNAEDENGTSQEIEVSRWMPTVQYPEETAPVPAPKPAPAKTAQVSTTPGSSAPVSTTPGSSALIPSPLRPSLEHNACYFLVDATSLDRACVRPSDTAACALYDSALHDTAQYALTAKPLQEPPQKGDTVIAMYTEHDAHYRAFVKRVSVAKNKYLIEYIEFGNEEIVPLERLYPCPRKLSLDAKPAQASIVKLSDRQPTTLTRTAKAFVERLKNGPVQLILSLPGGVRGAANGSLVNLVTAKNCDPINKKIEDLCTPEWVKLAERGGDVLEVECRPFSQLQYTEIPTDRTFTLYIPYCDIETFACGVLDGFVKGDKNANVVYGELSDQIAAYCESSLCREPYLPKIEEACITKYKRLNKWVRSVLLELTNGPGSRTAKVVNLDYGDVCLVPTADIRKMMPEFVDGYPALCHHFDIKGFPKNPTQYQLERGLRLMQVKDGVGEIEVRRASRDHEDCLEVDVPELIAAITQ